MAAVIVFAAAGYVLHHSDPVKGAGTTPTGSSLTGSDSAPDTTVQSASAAPSSTRAAPKRIVAFLGDDYTAGAGASAKQKRFTTLVAAHLGVIEKNFGIDGAGYAKAGKDGKTYADELTRIAADHPDVVVVSGGRNDVTDNLVSMASDAKALFATLRAKLPHATLIAVEPFWGDSDQPPELKTIAGAVATAVKSADGTYLALPDPLHAHPSFMADGADPNNAGYAAIAAALEPKLAVFVSA